MLSLPPSAFVTHQHSDHTADYNHLAGWAPGQDTGRHWGPPLEHDGCSSNERLASGRIGEGALPLLVCTCTS